MPPMITLTFLSPQGASHRVEVAPGGSLMLAAKHHNVPGIDADCGGACACATCHVTFDEADFQRVGPPGANEASLLDMVMEPQPGSRLSCQVELRPELNGLTVHLPASQS